MAYLARIEANEARAMDLPAPPGAVAQASDFSTLEWSVIRLSRGDRLWTIRPRGVVRRAFNAMIGRGNPELASERLEALRRMSVLSLHFGFTIDGRDLDDFLAAGFSEDQYELLVNSVRAPSRRQAKSTFKEARA